MNGGTRLLAGVGAVVLVVSALGFASPPETKASDLQPVRTEVSINR